MFNKNYENTIILYFLCNKTMHLFSRRFWDWFQNFGSFTCSWDLRVLVEKRSKDKKLPCFCIETIQLSWALENIFQQRRFSWRIISNIPCFCVAATMPLLLGLIMHLLIFKAVFGLHNAAAFKTWTFCISVNRAVGLPAVLKLSLPVAFTIRVER